MGSPVVVKHVYTKKSESTGHSDKIGLRGRCIAIVGGAIKGEMRSAVRDPASTDSLEERHCSYVVLRAVTACIPKMGGKGKGTLWPRP